MLWYWYFFLCIILFLFCLGGIVDIIVYEKLKGNKLKEFFKVSGGVCGGIFVDFKFYVILIRIFGGFMLREF